MQISPEVFLCFSPQPADGKALAESLKSNGSLRWLFLNSNNFGDCGAEALLGPAGFPGDG